MPTPHRAGTQPKPVVPIYLPSVRDRLEAIRRQIEAAGVCLGVDPDDLAAREVDRSELHLSADDVASLTMLLGAAWSACLWLHNLPDDLLDQPAPTDDQQDALAAAGGAR